MRHENQISSPFFTAMKFSLNHASAFTPEVPRILQQYGPKQLAHEYSIRTAEIEGIETFGTEKSIVV